MWKTYVPTGIGAVLNFDCNFLKRLPKSVQHDHVVYVDPKGSDIYGINARPKQPFKKCQEYHTEQEYRLFIQKDNIKNDEGKFRLERVEGAVYMYLDNSFKVDFRFSRKLAQLDFPRIFDSRKIEGREIFLMESRLEL